MASSTSDYALALGDDALIASQRMAEWITRAPQLEEDVALANIGLDLLGQARMLLSYAGSLLEPTRTEDELAYFRDAGEFHNVHLIERPNGDFAVTMARLLILSCYQCELYGHLSSSTDETLAAIATKAVKEVSYHRDHATQWVFRLGAGTEESHRRMQAGLEQEWPFVAELFDPSGIDTGLVKSGVAVAPPAVAEPVLCRIRDVLAQAGVAEPDTPPAVTGGRLGIHSESFEQLLDEMQHLARSHPGASW